MKNFFRKLKLKKRITYILTILHFFGNPSKRLKIIGVTGTNGKTTIATLLYRVAIALGYKAGLIGTAENLINGKEKVLPADGPSTSPDLVYLNQLLKEMVDEDCEYVFMEISSHAMQQNRLAGIKFTGGIFTNLTHDHLDYHKTFNNYFNAKKKFFNNLPSSAFALSNADDEYGKKILEGIRARKFLYEFSNIKGPASIANNFIAEITKIDFQGIQFHIGDNVIHSKLLGRFNAYNLLSVWSTCKILDFDMMKVKKVLENIEPPKGRFEYFVSSSGVTVIVDYAHTPDALEKVLKTILEIKKKDSRTISVFGCGGDRDPKKRPVMGRIGAELSDIAILTSDNPRSEDPNKIIQEIKVGLNEELLNKVRTITNRHEAIKEAVGIAKSGDIVLVAGKGHEDYQEIKGIKNHFDDMEELRKYT